MLMDFKKKKSNNNIEISFDYLKEENWERNSWKIFKLIKKVLISNEYVYKLFGNSRKKKTKNH